MSQAEGLPELPMWRQLYQETLFEIDRKKLPGMIRNAEHAILQRKQELYNTVTGPEYRSLCGALIVLRHLSRLYSMEEGTRSAA